MGLFHEVVNSTLNRNLRSKYLFLIVSFIIFVGLTLFLPRIPQPEWYHDFADKRAFLGVPYFMNVVSNVAFFLVSFIGLMLLSSVRVHESFKSITLQEWWAYFAFFLSVGFVGLGSGYYHLYPTTQTLLCDRLPMTLAFTSLLSAIVAERVSQKIGLWLLVPLLLSGSLGTLYWGYSEMIGSGDLRFYGLSQFLPVFYISVLLWLFPPSYSKSYYIVFALVWNAIAKVFEFSDYTTYKITAQIVSGHTLKHIFMSLAAYSIYTYLKEREPIS